MKKTALGIASRAELQQLLGEDLTRLIERLSRGESAQDRPLDHIANNAASAVGRQAGHPPEAASGSKRKRDGEENAGPQAFRQRSSIEVIDLVD